jgi:peroxiredoxin
MPRVSLDQIAPDFRLPDAAGNPVSLSQFRSLKNVLLIFNRGFA